MDQCKRSAESWTLQRLPPFERGEIKAFSGEGPGAPAIASEIGGGEGAAVREMKRGTERFEHFAKTSGARLMEKTAKRPILAENKRMPGLHRILRRKAEG
ncbi:MAG: hypothetical protein LBU32_02015 [Clostridiales bacterium]|nr:hypothetical protein [Clostridiales bacterium]